MTVFSNGTGFMRYEEKYCSKCIHYQDRPDIGDYGDCPILFAIFFYDDDSKLLDWFIPVKDKVFRDQCICFVDKTKVELYKDIESAKNIPLYERMGMDIYKQESTNPDQSGESEVG